jgi:hypothetical protein
LNSNLNLNSFNCAFSKMPEPFSPYSLILPSSGPFRLCDPASKVRCRPSISFASSPVSPFFRPSRPSNRRQPTPLSPTPTDANRWGSPIIPYLGALSSRTRARVRPRLAPPLLLAPHAKARFPRLFKAAAAEPCHEKPQPHVPLRLRSRNPR